MNKESIVAIIRIVLPCIISVCGVFGITSVFGVELNAINVEQVCSISAVMIGAFLSIFTGWVNNNVTEAAQAGQKVTDAIKRGDIE